MNSMDKTREYLKSIGLPGGDAYDLPTSQKRFKDGGQYRFEVPGIQGPKVMKALLEAMDSYGLYLHRVTQTQGIMRLTDEEIAKMVELAHQWQTDLILAIGPRATTDTSASVHTEEGVRMGYRLRGQEQIVRAIEDVKRAARLGCRGFLVYDEGCLWVLGQMRKDGEIPADCHFKVSAHAGHGNPASAKLLESIGADSINPVRDIQLVHVLFRGLDLIFRAGVLKAEDDGGQPRHRVGEYLGGEILRAGHVHRRSQAVLKELPICIFIEALRLHNELEIRVVQMVSHGLARSFLR